jgi:hypothetical protein
MACNTCETSFQGAQSIVVSIVKSGTNALLYVQNQGRNIVQIRRILICSSNPAGGYTILYLRPPPDAISWSYPSPFIEPGLTAWYYTWNNIPAGAIVQAQAEYIELEGRSRSCVTNF